MNIQEEQSVLSTTKGTSRTSESHKRPTGEDYRDPQELLTPGSSQSVNSWFPNNEFYPHTWQIAP
jgi:hypothetical protein